MRQETPTPHPPQPLPSDACTQTRLRRVRWESLTQQQQQEPVTLRLQLELHHWDQQSAENPKTSDMLGANRHIQIYTCQYIHIAGPRLLVCVCAGVCVWGGLGLC